MIIREYTVSSNGFRGQLYDPENKTDKVIIVFLGGEGKFISAGLIAEKFAENGYAALALYYWNGLELPKHLSMVPLDMVEKAIAELKKYNNNQFSKIAAYGISLGSILALMAGALFDDINAVIAVSPTHIIPEGFISRKKASGESFLSFHGQPYDFTPINASSSMYEYFSKAYASNNKAFIPVENIKGKVLLLTGEKDFAWPSTISVNEIKNKIEAAGFCKELKVHIYKDGTHYIGVMPDVRKYKRLKLMRLFSKEEMLHPKACAKAQRQSESDVLEFLDSI